MKRRLLAIAVMLIVTFSFSLTYGQNITGKIINEEDRSEMVGIRVFLEGTEYEAFTNGVGNFSIFEVEDGTYELVVELPEEDFNYGEVAVAGESVKLGNILVEKSMISIDPMEIAVINLNTADDDGNEAISSVLTAGNDPFVEAATYDLGSGRFRIRGYNYEDRTTYLNGFKANDLDDGSAYWGLWGGLNDVFRVQSNTFTLDPLTYGFGEIGGGSFIDLRASVQRPQTKAVYNLGNRSYTHRLMLTHSSGEMKNGWSYSFSGSRRWGERGYVEGTFYDAWSYFASIEKKIGDNHRLNFVTFGSPTTRGRSTGSTQEMYDLTDNNYYNPNWGYQNGEVRNSRNYNFHQPIAMLRHDWDISDKVSLMTNVTYQTGYNGTTRLDWFNAPDPRPEYYRKLPSYQLTEENAAIVRDYIKNNVDAQQIDWDFMYGVNQNSNVTIENANGSGESLTGRMSSYVVEEQRYDSDKIALNSNVTAFVTKNMTLTGGVNFLYENVDNYKLLNDLLGGEFYVNLDKFADRDFPDNEIFAQNDLQNFNGIVYEGDRYGWNYEIVSRNGGGWLQSEWEFSTFDFFAAVEASQTSFYRDGKYQNGKFPESSLGKSETQNFFNYGGKAGITYKLDGRNYFVANGTYRTRAPFSRFAYTSPRTRDQLLPDLQNEKIMGGEIGYIFRYPGLKGRITAFYTEFRDRLESRQIYFDAENSFGTYALRGVNTRHQGVEFGMEAKATKTLSVTFAGSVGANQYNSRPTRYFTIDNQPFQPVTDEIAYIKNYYLPGPQTALSLGLDYRSPKFWFATLSINHFRGMYLDIFPERRTDRTISNIVLPDNRELFDDVIGQTKLENQFSLDFFGGKSWRWDDYYMFLYLSVGNLLNNKDFVTGGFEQFRYDFENHDVDRFEPRTFYAYGINYSIGLTFSF